MPLNHVVAGRLSSEPLNGIASSCFFTGGSEIGVRACTSSALGLLVPAKISGTVCKTEQRRNGS
jgi:hypothetical protein